MCLTKSTKDFFPIEIKITSTCFPINSKLITIMQYLFTY